MAKEIFKKLTFAMILSAIIYLSFSLFAATFNIQHWGEGTRFFCSLGVCFASIMLVTYPNKL